MRRRRASSDEDALGALIVIVIAIFAIGWLIEHVILPGLLIIAGIVASVGGLFALYTSCRVFGKAVLDNKYPYSIYTDPYPHAPGVKRGYFFGPGFNQLKKVWSASQEGMDEAISKIIHTSEGELQQGGLTMFFCINLWIYLFLFVSCLSLYVFGYMFTFAFCCVLSVILAAGFLLFFSCYILLKLSDQTALLLNSIESRCPKCKRRSEPMFQCPKCHTLHILHPGPYGIFHTKCSCGELLPTTAFNGRNNLVAFCPVCREPLKGYAEHFGIQVVGSTSSGKTTYLASFFHEYLSQLPSYIKSSCTPQKNFDDLEKAYVIGSPIPGTTEMNAGMYSITHEFPMHAPYQFSMYDIAGEAFQNIIASGYQQQQFQYSEGLILMIDPDNSPEVSQTTISSFCAEHKKLKNITASHMSPVPVAVLITKADMYGEELSGDYQDQEQCIRFLEAHGFGSVIRLISSEFINIKYFVVSALGHTPDSTEYKPLGVVEPVMWILGAAKSVLGKIIKNGISTSDKVKFMLRKFVPFFLPAVILCLLFWGISNVSWGKILQTTQNPSDHVQVEAKALARIPPSSLHTGKTQHQTKPAEVTPKKHVNPTVNTTQQNTTLVGKIQQAAQHEYRSRDVKKDVPATSLKLSTLGTKINVRRRPDINSDSLEMLDEGVPVEAKEHEQRSDGVWYKVTIPGGREGWIRSELLKPRIGDKGEHGGVFMRVVGDDVNLRTGPSKKNSSIGKLYTGHLVEVVGSSGVWRKVYTQTGDRGWVHSGFLGKRQRFKTF